MTHKLARAPIMKHKKCASKQIIVATPVTPSTPGSPHKRKPSVYRSQVQSPDSTYLVQILNVFDFVVDEPHIEAGLRVGGLLFVLTHALILALGILRFLLSIGSDGIFARPALFYVQSGTGLAENPISVERKEVDGMTVNRGLDRAGHGRSKTDKRAKMDYEAK